MKKKPTKLEAKVAELERKIEEFERFKQRAIGDLLKVNELNKPKEPETFEDCCIEVARKNPAYDAYFKSRSIGSSIPVTTIPSEKRAKQLAAIAKMMTVADALGGKREHHVGYGIFVESDGTPFVGMSCNQSPKIEFKDKQTAEKAIKILGEETIKTAFGL